MRIKHFPSLIIAYLALNTICFAALQTISVEFFGKQPTPFLAATDVAGVIPADNWNSSLGASAGFYTPMPLVDSNGDASGVILSDHFRNNDERLSVPANPTTTQLLFRGYTESQNNGGTGFTITNIPFAEYDLYVYVMSGNAGRRGFVTTTEAGTDDYYYQTAGGIPTSFIEVTSTSSAEYTVGGNYAVFRGLGNSSQTVTLSGLNSWSGIAGFQIQQIPEPASAGCLIGGAAVLLCLVLRRLV